MKEITRLVIYAIIYGLVSALVVTALLRAVTS